MGMVEKLLQVEMPHVKWIQKLSKSPLRDPWFYSSTITLTLTTSSQCTKFAPINIPYNGIPKIVLLKLTYHVT